MICKYSGNCASSNFGGEDICSTNPEDCERYQMFEKEAKIVGMLPQEEEYHEKDKNYPETFFEFQDLSIKKRFGHSKLSVNITEIDVIKSLENSILQNKK